MEQEAGQAIKIRTYFVSETDERSFSISTRKEKSGVRAMSSGSFLSSSSTFLQQVSTLSQTSSAQPLRFDPMGNFGRSATLIITFSLSLTVPMTFRIGAKYRW